MCWLSYFIKTSNMPSAFSWWYFKRLSVKYLQVLYKIFTKKMKFLQGTIGLMKLLEGLTFLLGIRINSKQMTCSQIKKSSFSIYLLFGFVVFFINVSSNLLSVTVFFDNIFKSDIMSLSRTSYLSKLIGHVSFIFVVIGSHAILLSQPQKSEWKHLWNSQVQFFKYQGNNLNRYSTSNNASILIRAFIVLFLMVHRLLV